MEFASTVALCRSMLPKPEEIGREAAQRTLGLTFGFSRAQLWAAVSKRVKPVRDAGLFNPVGRPHRMSRPFRSGCRFEAKELTVILPVVIWEKCL